MRSRVATRRWLGHRPMPPPSGYNVEVTSLATDGRTSRDYSRITGKQRVIGTDPGDLRSAVG